MVRNWLRYWFDGNQKSQGQPPFGFRAKNLEHKWEINYRSLNWFDCRISGCHQQVLVWSTPQTNPGCCACSLVHHQDLSSRLWGYWGVDSPSFRLVWCGNVELWNHEILVVFFFGSLQLAHYNPFNDRVVSTKFVRVSVTVQWTSTVGSQDEFVEEEPIADVPFAFWHKDDKGWGHFPGHHRVTSTFHSQKNGLDQNLGVLCELLCRLARYDQSVVITHIFRA